MLSDVARALGQLGDARFLGAVLKALGVTIAVLAAASWALFALFGWLFPDSFALPWIGEVSLTADWLSWAGILLLTLASVFLMLPVAFVCVGFFLDDVVDAVEAKHYPHLPPAPRLSIPAALREAVSLLALVVLVNAAALLVYLLSTVAAPVVFWVVNGFLLGREYFQLVAERRLGRRPGAALRRAHRGQVWALGVLLAVPLSVPLVNLLVPVLGVAAYTHMFHRLSRPAG